MTPERVATKISREVTDSLLDQSYHLVQRPKIDLSPPKICDNKWLAETSLFSTNSV